MTKKPRIYLVLTDREQQAVQAARARSPFPLQTKDILHTWIATGIKQMYENQPKETAKK